jgi:DNA-binding SARP family transcriptional activator
VAEVVSDRLHELSPSAIQVVVSEATLRPDRWRDALRRAIRPDNPAAAAAGSVLEQVGTADDVPFLRKAAKALKRKGSAASLGRDLARRVAPRVFVEDQGRLQVRVGGTLIPDDEVRRKVLLVVCFLITRPGLSATRDEVVEAVWPEVDPDSAVNSLNQTLYFLRRALDPRYKEDLSPNYVHHDSDVIWLDDALVDSRSHLCIRLIEAIAQGLPEGDIGRLAREYRGKFALDFAYEEWANAYRETLHASYLETMERAIVTKIETGHPAHAIALARRALQVDPSAEELERLLLRAYHEAGSRAAVGEQYAHYASFLKNDLGIDPPALRELIDRDFELL